MIGHNRKEDVLYAGDITKWKKYAYSLLLRAGMRLSKVDAAKAQTTVQAAFAGGVITDNADNAYMRHDANYTATNRQYTEWKRSRKFLFGKAIC